MQNTSYAQFAIINDADGFVNVRDAPNKSGKVIGKIYEGSIFFTLWADEDTSWTTFDCLEKGCERAGYVHKSRVKYLSSFSNVPNIQNEEMKSVYRKDSIQVSITLSKFNLKANKIDTPGEDFKINGADVWGADAYSKPETQFKLVEIKIGEHKIIIPQEGLQNVFIPFYPKNRNNFSSQVTYDKKSDTLYIINAIGDAGLSYELLWIIEKGEYKKRLVTIGF